MRDHFRSPAPMPVMAGAKTLNCESCGAATVKMQESRLLVDGGRRRRYRCLSCDYRWTTYQGQGPRAPGDSRRCYRCVHFLRKCVMDFPEAVQEGHAFATVCPAFTLNDDP